MPHGARTLVRRARGAAPPCALYTPAGVAHWPWAREQTGGRPAALTLAELCCGVGSGTVAAAAAGLRIVAAVGVDLVSAKLRDGLVDALHRDHARTTVADVCGLGTVARADIVAVTPPRVSV